MIEDEVPSKIEPTTEEVGSEPLGYEPGSGNSILDSLFASEERPPDPTPVEDVGDTTPSVSIEQALFKAAELGKVEEETVKEEVKEDEPTKEVLKTESLDEFVPLPEPEPEPEPTEPPNIVDEMVASVIGLKLSPEDQEVLDLAKYATSKHGIKYPSLAKDYAEFLVKKEEFLRKNSDDEYFEFDPASNEEVARFVKENEPKFSFKDRKDMEKAQLKDELIGEARDEIARENYKRDLKDREPVIQDTVRAFTHRVAKELFPEDIAEFVKEHGIEKAREHYAFEVPVLEQSLQQVTFYANEFLSLSQGIKSYDPNNQVHSQISDFVQTQGEIFHKEGGQSRLRGDKQFTTRSNYNQMNTSQKSRHWTFSDSEILEMVQYQVKEGAKTQIDDIRNKLSRYGGRAPAPAPDLPTPAPAPKARSPKSAGAMTSVTVDKPNVNSLVSILGI